MANAKSASSFTTYRLSGAVLSDLSADEFPTRLAAWKDDVWELSGDGTHFGFVYAGIAELSCDSGNFTLGAGMYFSTPGAMRIRGGAGIVATRLGYRGFFQAGGPVETRGRLRYIDGCTDSLLLAPVMRGDPCLNLLHFPAHTLQAAHTHPSLRAGLVLRGQGECVMPEGRLALEPGCAFVIRAGCLHSFHTQESELLVAAYHPDSDFGPTHENHPMINRTVIAAESIRHG